MSAVRAGMLSCVCTAARGARLSRLATSAIWTSVRTAAPVPPLGVYP